MNRHTLTNRSLSADSPAEALLLAGQHAAPGLYREIGTQRLVLLDKQDTLPASCDGRVTCYERMSELWGQVCFRSAQNRRIAGKPAAREKRKEEASL